MNNNSLIRELTDLIARLERTPETETPEQLVMRLTRLAEARAELRRLQNAPSHRA